MLSHGPINSAPLSSPSNAIYIENGSGGAVCAGVVFINHSAEGTGGVRCAGVGVRAAYYRLETSGGVLCGATAPVVSFVDLQLIAVDGICETAFGDIHCRRCRYVSSVYLCQNEKKPVRCRRRESALVPAITVLTHKLYLRFETVYDRGIVACDTGLGVRTLIDPDLHVFSVPEEAEPVLSLVQQPQVFVKPPTQTLGVHGISNDEQKVSIQGVETATVFGDFTFKICRLIAADYVSSVYASQREKTSPRKKVSALIPAVTVLNQRLFLHHNSGKKLPPIEKKKPNKRVFIPVVRKASLVEEEIPAPPRTQYIVTHGISIDEQVVTTAGVSSGAAFGDFTVEEYCFIPSRYVKPSHQRGRGALLPAVSVMHNRALQKCHVHGQKGISMRKSKIQPLLKK